jgi:hypothetical protein
LEILDIQNIIKYSKREGIKELKLHLTLGFFTEILFKDFLNLLLMGTMTVFTDKNSHKEQESFFVCLE